MMMMMMPGDRILHGRCDFYHLVKQLQTLPESTVAAAALDGVVVVDGGAVCGSIEGHPSVGAVP